jgi:hypothetical protein
MACPDYLLQIDVIYYSCFSQRQAAQARRASRRHKPFHYIALLRRCSEGSKMGGVIFRLQWGRRQQAHVGRNILMNKLSSSKI